MVYRGKPSRGCAPCRQRRVKCERQLHGCANCQRAKRACPGYRNELDLAFCDESERVRSKYQNDSASHEHQDEQQIVVARNVLLPSMSDFSLSYFHHHHCVRPASVFIASDVLLASMSALGAASYSNAARTFDLELEATKRYVTAVQLLNNALLTRHTAAQDSTLLSVLILGCYEMITGNRRVTIDQWAAHIKGTVALLRLRTQAQMETVDGRLLFLQASTMTILECSRRATRVPSDMYLMLDECAKHVGDGSDSLWMSQICKTQDIHMRAMDLYSDVVHGKIVDEEAIVSQVLELDQAFSGTFTEASNVRTYKVVASPPDNPFKSYCPYIHVYQSALSAQMWNAVRSSRIFLHWIITSTLRKSSHHPRGLSSTAGQTQIEASKSTATQLQLDIFASVYQHIRDRPMGPDGPAGLFASPVKRHDNTSFIEKNRMINYGDIKLPVIQTTRGYHLLWCLAGIAEKGNLDLRPAAREMMEVIGETLGIRQAFALIEGITEDDPV